MVERVSNDPHSAAIFQDSAANNETVGDVPSGTSSPVSSFSHEPGKSRDEKGHRILSAKKPQLAIIAGEFHKELAEEMISAATSQAEELGAEVGKVIYVAGSYEAPLIADILLSKKNIDLLVVLGYIEKGETLHGEVMGNVVQKSLVDLQLKHGKPIGIGIIGPGATKAQAEARKIGAAKGAVQAAVKSHQILQDL